MHIAQLDLSEQCSVSIYVQGVAGGLLAPDSLLQPLSCPALLLLCRLLVSCCYLLVALQTNGCCALVVLVVYEQQDHVQHAECSRQTHCCNSRPVVRWSAADFWSMLCARLTGWSYH